MENPADHQCIEWKTTFPVNMFVSDRFYRPQRSRVCRLPGLLRQTHVRDTGAAAIRVDDSHCTKSVTAAATYDTDDEAVAIANNSIYGLSGEVSSADTERALRVAQRMRTGSVTVNGSTFFGITSPFGGTKQSGLGRRNGEQGFKEYLEIKTIGLPA